MVMERRPELVSVLGIAAAVVAIAVLVFVLGESVAPAAASGLLAIAIPFVGAATVPAVSLGGDGRRNWFAVAIALLTAATTLRLIPHATTTGTHGPYRLPWASVMDVTFGLYVDALGVMLASIASVVGALVVVYSTRFMEREEGLARYYALILLFVGAMVGFSLADSLVALYVFWEVLGLCSFALISFWMTDPNSTRAGLKAFVTTRFGDVGLLAGVAVLFAGTGSVSLQHIATTVETVPSWVLGWAGMLFLVAAIGKSAQFPLHVWLPDAMEAPTTATALIHAAAMVNAGVYLLARTAPIFGRVAWWPAALMLVGAVSALLAAVLATYERDLKRALAYCTISQLGYMVAGIGLSGGLFAATFHLLSHSIFKALLFLGAGAVIYALGGSVHRHVDMFEHAGVANVRQMPVTNVAFLVGLLSLVGVPGTSGFWSKELVLHAGLHGGPLELVTFVLLAATAVLTTVYSVRIYHLVFMGDPATTVERAPLAISIPLVILTALTLTAWLAVEPLSASLSLSLATVSVIPLTELVGEVLTVTPLLLSGVFLLGGYLGFRYRRAVGTAVPPALTTLLDWGYGFDAAYRTLVDGYRALSAEVSRTQTGDVNYNLVGLVIATLVGVGVAFLWV